MADLKISQLSDGGNSQATDEYVIARSGANYRIDGASVAAAATSVGTLTSLTVSGAVSATSTTDSSSTTTGAIVTAGGVGIAKKLYVGTELRAGNATDPVLISASGTYGIVSFNNTASTSTSLGIFGRINPGEALYYNVPTGYSHKFSINGATSLTLDASGNLGLGVTPSAWQSGWKVLETQGGFLGGGGTTYIEFGQNIFYDGAFKYKANGLASLYEQSAGLHKWYVAPNNTSGAGATISTLTQAMTLDASGNLGVGTASPSGRLTLQRASAGADTDINWKNELGNDRARIRFGGTNEELSFWTPGGAGATERARITSGGYFKASNTGTYAGSTGAYHEFRSDANDTVLYLSNTNAAYTNDLVFVDTTTAAGTGFDFFDVRANNVGQFRVRGDGTIYAQNTTVQSISDARLKENVIDATDGLSVITALRPVRYDWKAGYGNDRKHQLGFIAQEVEAVFPEAVSVWEMDEPTGEVDEDGKPITEKVDYKTVGPGALIPVLVKAIQELEARIAVLEA